MGKRAARKNHAAAQGKFSYGVDRPPLSWLCFFYTNANAFCLRLHQTGKQRANTNLQTFHGSAFSIQMPMLFV
jgi:hypothetical protein